MKTIVETYAEFAAKLRFNDLSKEVVQRSKESVLDLIGVMLAGSGMPFPQAAREYFSTLGGKPEATMIRTDGQKFPAPTAALPMAFAHMLWIWTMDTDTAPFIPAHQSYLPRWHRRKR